MTMSYNEAVARFAEYKRKGLVRRAKHLIENIDNVLTCINLDFGRDASCFKHNVSALFKLSLYEQDIVMASNESDIKDIISVAKFMLKNKDLLADEIDSIDRAKMQLTLRDPIVIDSDEDELPDIITQDQTVDRKSKTTVKGIRGFHRFKPYRKNTATVSTTSNTFTESQWLEREEHLLRKHAQELSLMKDETRKELLQCVICLSNQKEYTLIPCGHTFCEMCLCKMEAMGKPCFFCKTTVTSSVRMRLTD